jgi:hypothetical protein
MSNNLSHLWEFADFFDENYQHRSSAPRLQLDSIRPLVQRFRPLVLLPHPLVQFSSSLPRLRCRRIYLARKFGLSKNFRSLAADCGCQESNGDYPGPVFMISTDPKHRLRLSAPRGARSHCLTYASFKTTVSVRGCGKGFKFGLAQNFSYACLGFRPSEAQQIGRGPNKWIQI